MFTGIIQAVGHVSHVQETRGGDAQISIAAGGLDMNDVALGDSIACNGVCLTVVDKTQAGFNVVVSGETFACTIGFAPGDALNLEKAMRLSDRLGGHLVSGHVDGVGEVMSFEQIGESWRLVIRVPDSLARYVVHKGSVAVNGVSLTVNQVHGREFSINLIPHTLENTMLHTLKPGMRVNLEADMLARYAERLLTYLNDSDKD